MKIGISRPPTPPHPLPDVDGALVAQQAEALGFESVFYGEHPIRPVDQPGRGVHAHGIPFFQDTIVMLARASAMTSTITLGGGVFLVPEHNPVLFAKQLASIDHYSGGRLIVGAGIGWSRAECEILGGNFDRRWAQTREAVELMKRLWTEETVEYHGELFDIPPVQLYPQPKTPGGPPVLIGAGAGEAAFRRVARYADGWLPAFTTRESIETAPDTIEAGRRRIAELRTQHGREDDPLEITAIVRGPQIDGDLGPTQRVDRDQLRRLADAGCDRALVSLSTLRTDEDIEGALAHIAEHCL